MMKAQVLANFLVECIWSNEKLEELPTTQANSGPTWIFHVDGLSTLKEVGVD